MTVDLQRTVSDAAVEELTAFVSDPQAPKFLVENVVVRVIPQALDGDRPLPPPRDSRSHTGPARG